MTRPRHTVLPLPILRGLYPQIAPRLGQVGSDRRRGGTWEEFVGRAVCLRYSASRPNLTGCMRCARYAASARAGAFNARAHCSSSPTATRNYLRFIRFDSRSASSGAARHPHAARAAVGRGGRRNGQDERLEFRTSAPDGELVRISPGKTERWLIEPGRVLEVLEQHNADLT
jgi:hypothetical protein